MGRVVVAGLGPAGPGLVNLQTLQALDRIPNRYLRTSRHPAAEMVPDATTFDALYEHAERVEDVYAAIVDVLVEAAQTLGEVLYLVPGSPLVAERTVVLLRDDPRVEVELLPALSYLDLAWAALRVDPLAAGVRLVDGKRFAEDAAGERGPLLVAQTDDRLVLSAVKLAVDGDAAAPVTVLQRLGLPDEHVFEVPWSELDRSFEPDHLTTLWIPQLAAPVGQELVRFHELVRTLREQCPWDQEQTHQTLTRHLLEESYEVLEAIEALDLETGAGDDHLCEELGDLLFQVEFHATIAEQEGRFTMADVARGIHDKLVRRHPHVFGTVEATTADDVLNNWEQIKQAEKGHASVMDGLPGNLPSLLYAHKVQKKAAAVGFDWDDVAGAFPKIEEETTELRAALDAGAGANDVEVRDELGDLLFAVVNVARHAGVDAEAALRAATAKFRHRFQGVERLAEARGLVIRDLSLGELDALWDEVKATS